MSPASMPGASDAALQTQLNTHVAATAAHGIADTSLLTTRADSAERPEWHGAVGDGVTDDTAALLAAAATGKNVILSLGKTYLHRRTLALTFASQQLVGGGTLKRAAQAVTTTTTAITSGVTSQITVAATSGGGGAGAWSLQVGDQIVVEQGGTFDQASRTITAINGLAVTISGTFGVSLSGTINVRHGWNQLSLKGAGCQVRNVTVDGNSSNWSWGRWQHTAAVVSDTGDGQSVVHSRIVNQYGDGFSPASFGFECRSNLVQNISGRGWVVGGLNNQFQGPQNVVAFNRFLTCNTDSAVSGSDGQGSIDFSQGGPATVILGNYVDGGIDGIGSVRSWNNSRVTIEANEIRNCTGWGISAVGGGTNAAKSVTINANRIYGCGISINNVGGAGVAQWWRITNNQVHGGRLIIDTLKDATVSGNEITPMQAPAGLTATAQAGGGTFAAGTVYYQWTATNASGETIGSDEISVVVALNGSVQLTAMPVANATGYRLYRATGSGGETTSPALVTTIAATPGTYVAQMISFTDTGAALAAGSVPTNDSTFSGVDMVVIGASGGLVQNLQFSDNRIRGGQRAINVNNAAVTNTQVHGNLCVGQTTAGIATIVGTSRVTLKENTVVGDGAAINGYIGMSIASGEVTANTVDLSQIANTVTGLVGISVIGATAVPVRANTVKVGSSGGSTISVQSSSTSTVVMNNTLDKDVSDGSSTTTKVGNKTNSGALSGVATLVAGTVTVATNEVQGDANPRVELSNVGPSGGALGVLVVASVSGFTNFVIQSRNPADGTLQTADTSKVAWRIVR